jgi:hypothetical protein
MILPCLGGVPRPNQIPALVGVTHDLDLHRTHKFESSIRIGIINRDLRVECLPNTTFVAR